MERSVKGIIARLRLFVCVISSVAGLVCAIAPPSVRADDSTVIPTANDLLNNIYSFKNWPSVTLPANPTWSENPFNDINWVWNYQSLQYVTTLVEAWQMTGSQSYLNRAQFLLSDWYRDNPISSPPRSAYSWSTVSDATGIRAEVYVNAAEILPHAGWLDAAILEHGQVLANPKYYTGLTNHDLTKSIALVEVGGYLRRNDWLSLGVGRINDMAGSCVDSQGANTEQSVPYAALNYTLYENAAQIITQNGQPLGSNFARVNMMPLFLAYGTLPDGTYAMLGDGGVVTALPIEGTPAEYAATQGQSGPKPPDTVAVYDSAGYAFARTGWGETQPFADETMLTVRFGPARQVHGHYDGSSITLFSYGTPLLLGTGTYTYSANDYRTYFVSRDSHNLVTVDNATLDPNAPTAEMWTRESPTMFEIATSSQPYLGFLDQRRTSFSRGSGYVVVDDRLSGASSATYRQLWHLKEDSNPTTTTGVSAQVARPVNRSRVGVPSIPLFTDSTTWTQRPRGNLLIMQLLPAGIQTVMGQTSPIQGWLSYDYNVKLAAPVVEALQTGSAVEFLTLLIPFETSPPAVQVNNLVVTTDGYSMTLTINGHTDQLIMNANSSEITPQN